MFQFHSGSIKSARIARQSVLYDMFQFHSGSIKRRARGKAAPQGSGFNSIVVRLKVSFLKSISLLLKCFNSIVVRLKGDSLSVAVK